MRNLIAAVVALMLAGFAPPASLPRGVMQSTPVQPVKLGFDYLTPVQYKELWKRADAYAMAEAFLRKCAKPSFIEVRMRAAAAPCVKPDALHRVAIYFRNKVAQFSRQHNYICDTEQSRSLVRYLRARIDQDVNEVRSMCSACFFC
jgi:hypothetical protein